jgi:hypothetical protein
MTAQPTIPFVADRRARAEAQARQVYKAVATHARNVFSPDVTRGAVTPFTIASGAGFAQTSIEAIGSLLGPASASGELFRRALNVTLDGNYGVTVPNIAASAAGVSFVSEGNPLKVRNFTFDSVTLTPLKIGFISALTREVAEATSAEAMVRDVMARDLSLGVDTFLLDATAGSTTRPAGLRNGVAAISAASGGGATALASDLAALAGAVAAVGGTDVIFVAAAKEAMKIKVLTPLLTVPVFASSGLADGTVVAIAPSALVVAGSPDAPRIEISKETTLHFEDTTPLALSTVGTPNTVAAPVRSLYQTDCVAIRLIAELNWVLRSSSGIAWTQSVTW